MASASTSRQRARFDQGIGINRFSLYSTFGDKHQLFVPARDRYHDTIGGDLVGELEHTASGRAAMRHFFTRLVNVFASAHGWQ
jgi:hypothetical protein